MSEAKRTLTTHPQLGAESRITAYHEMMRFHHSLRTLAFSLIELLVVMSIVALLLGILLPALASARQRARTMKGLAHLSQIGRGIHAYAHEYRGMLPIGYLNLDTTQDTNWTTLLHGYLTASGMTNANLNPASFLGVFQDPNAQVPGGRVHFSAHPILIPDLSSNRPIQTTTSLWLLKRTIDIVMVMDGSQDPTHQFNAHATAWQLDGGQIWTGWRYDLTAPDNADPIDPGPNEDTPEGAGHIRWRQVNNSANFLYADGHAITRRPDQITKTNVRVN